MPGILLFQGAGISEGALPSVAGRVRHIAEPLPQVVQFAGVVLFELIHEAGVLDGDATLLRQGCHELHLVLAECPDLAVVQPQHTDGFLLAAGFGVLQLTVVFDIGNDDWFSGGEGAGYTPTHLRYPAFDGTMAGLKASIKS